MTVQENTALVHRLFAEVWNQGSLAVAPEIIHESYEGEIIWGHKADGATMPPRVSGPRALEAEIDFYHGLYSDLRFAPVQMMAKGDTVIGVWKASGNSTTETFTSRNGSVRPRELRGQVVSIHRVENGKIRSTEFYWPRDPLFP